VEHLVTLMMAVHCGVTGGGQGDSADGDGVTTSSALLDCAMHRHHSLRGVVLVALVAKVVAATARTSARTSAITR
jgi:hypothetical protein